MMTTTMIEELKRLEAEATQGKWELVSGTGYHGPYIDSPIGRTICDFYVLKRDNSPKNFDEAEANAALIVAMRNALPELLKALEEARALRLAAQKYLDVTKEYFSDTEYDRNGLLAEADADLYVLLYELLPPHGGGDVG